jgi:Zn-dependent protease with chaperone function
MKTTILTALLFFCITATAQLQPVYLFQQDDTVLKREYYNKALQKKSSLIANLPKEYNKDYKKAYNEMFTTAKDLLLSTRSVTEKKAHDFIQAVAAKIIQGNPELQKLDIRIVFSRDFAPNAFSVGDGTIALNGGLFVYLNSEAEMAFVLCHELAHYYLAHSMKRINRYVQVANSDSIKKELKRLSKQEYKVGEQLEKLLKELTFDIRRHSRTNEEEADKMGLQFLKKSGYNGRGFISVMQVLDKIDDTTLLAPLHLTQTLSMTGHVFNERWIKKESSIFAGVKSEDSEGLSAREKDSLKTHPDCMKRMALLQNEAEQIQGASFSVNESLFKQLKQEFVPEIIEQVYRDENISYNLYLCLQLLQAGKHIPFAISSIGRNFNLIYKKQKEHTLGLMIDTENKKYSENYNLLLRMLNRLRLPEIADLNAAFCTHYQKEMKEYTGFADILNTSIENKKAHQ